MFFKSSCVCNRKGEEPKLVLGYTTLNFQSQEVGGIRVEEEENLCNMEDECNPKSGGRSQNKIKWKYSSSFTILSFKTCESSILDLPKE